jgi:hypothetical protein
MSRFKKTLWIGAPIIILAALVGWRFANKRATEGEQTQQMQARQGGAPPVELAVAGPRTIVEGTNAVGTAEAVQQAGRLWCLTRRSGG